MIRLAAQSLRPEDDEWQEETMPLEGFPPSPEWHLLKQNETYAAYAKDLEFMWRWVIIREGRIIQEGCSLSLRSSIRAVTHVLNYYGMSEAGLPAE